MTRYAIFAYDYIYGGSHGMYAEAIFEGTEKEAREYAEELSMEVINGYSEIYDQIEQDLEEYLNAYSIDANDEEGIEVRRLFYHDDIVYKLYELDETLINCGINKLEEEFYNDKDAFLAKYQKT